MLQLINFYQGLCLSLAVSSLATLGLSTFSDQWEGAMVVGEAGEQQRLQSGERVGWETPW